LDECTWAKTGRGAGAVLGEPDRTRRTGPLRGTSPHWIQRM